MENDWIIWLLVIALPLAAYGVVAFFGRGPEDSIFVALLRVLNTLITRGIHRLTVIGSKESLPAAGPCIVVANHRSSVDPFLVAGATRRWISYLMAREYYETPVLHWMFRGLRCIPVNRDGSDLGATRAALKTLRAGRVIGIFPQGGIRDPDDELDVAKAGVALLAARSGAPVVPFFVDGSPSMDSVYLSMLRPSRSRVWCGEPLTFPPSEQKPTRKELEEFTRRILAALSDLRRRSKESAAAARLT
ncbi:MAG: 1-acyl-sn-glycerol-3-phosphate acyltransferase [Planctomycetes bacterium]|nr:1-acyl-sn-glycerol-3-phosphate acyltransferase [Planctomycetota bacterium]